MSETPEKNIRFKAILIYVIVAFICGGMLIYIYKLRDDIDDQKRSISQYYKELSLVNELIDSVNASQSEVNMYVSTKQIRHYKSFNESLNIVEQLMDSLSHINPLHNDKLQQINHLLVKKGVIVSNLNKQFNNKNPIESINEILKEIDPVIKKDTVLVTTTVQDTIIYSGPQKGFWRKLGELFSSSKGADTVTSITTARLDTLTVPKNDTLHVVTEVTEIAEQAKDDYVKRIISIEKNLSSLIVADQEISSEITTLLIGLYNQTVQARLDEIQKSEQLIRNNNTYSIISSIVSLILIFIFISLIISDVNKSYRLRKNVERANLRIKQIMDSRHKLLLSISHDIKTPLNSILGTLELKETSNGFLHDEVRTMKDSGEYILALLGNLLEFSSIEQGTSNISNRIFNLHALCQQTVEMFIPLANKKNLTLAYSFDFDKNLILSSDSLKIKQILINILSNSIKYTLEGFIQFNVKYSDSGLYCTIEDTGVGIPENQIKNIFQPFSRVDQNSHLSEGSGFGMYVVKGLVDLFQGNIKVTSEEGKGTRTEISIPVSEVSINETFIPKRILIVDDDISYLIIIRNMLSDLGHIPSMCGNIADFENIITEINQYDEILTDMEMENFNGIDVLNRIKYSGINIPVTVVTAREDINNDDFIRMGFKAYIKKPISTCDLKLLFGGQIKDERVAGFSSLNKMLEEDSDALHEVLTSFVDSTTENIGKLKQAVLNSDYNMAQFISHKMQPMFIQVGAVEKLDILKKLDAHRLDGMSMYPGWEDDVLELIEYAEQIITETENYLKSH
ncbi:MULTISPECIES: hybrid sensor histidine kinase/response regulator [unclassified Dysgonomonas]|jgi:signal transduction histidine kinase/DNA-binding NarL/FixJ family response regulator|uniref:hybrid sensor histidine kinase/response regulator n=1 Tax=unclassified Dysgonomonas TaxID=2630389 RepID=UPI0025C45252|nr:MULTISPECIES: hybrid sensor histidine kinase/response regulator [unclassified Dysgonomonas]MDR2002798.1 hybrid sensor histidine kinase/response regulator [Prevotella sp.]HMM03459.1 hybrid sensor histidine kinase/response regulator [Dysgonomonas sp.]